MCKRLLVCACALSASFVAPAIAQVAPPTTLPATVPVEPATQPVAMSHVIAVTVYQGTALVTREVEVKEGAGLMELVVNPLPPQTIDSSLFTESSDGIRVLTTQISVSGGEGGHAGRGARPRGPGPSTYAEEPGASEAA